MLLLEEYLTQARIPNEVLSSEEYKSLEERFFVEKKTKNDLLALVQSFFEQKGFTFVETEDEQVFQLETEDTFAYSISLVEIVEKGVWVRVLLSGIKK